MRAKFAFIVGLAIGYVFGTRAGRERYEQIKRAAQTLWDSPGVRRGREQVGGYAADVRANVQDSVLDAGKSFIQALADFAKTRAPGASAPTQSPAPASENADAANEPKAPTKPSSASSTAKKPSPRAKKPASKGTEAK